MEEEFVGIDLPSGGSVILRLIEDEIFLDFLVILQSDRKVSELFANLEQGDLFFVPEKIPDQPKGDDLSFILLRLQDWIDSTGSRLRLLSP